MQEITEFVLIGNPRKFKVGDRVKIYLNQKWWSGNVEYFKPWRWKEHKVFYNIKLPYSNGKYELIEMQGDIAVYDDYHYAYMYVRTDERVGEADHLFEGFGVRSGSQASDIIFEHEDEYIPPPPFISIEKNNEEHHNPHDADLPF